MSGSPFHEPAHRVHDYARLVRRWRAVARGAGLKLEEFARQDEYPVYCVRTQGDPAAGGLYVSAGIHGDEPAGPEAVARWAEAHLKTHVRDKPATPLFILPCLNPWGLVHNRRSDHRSRDLNRIFDGRVAPISQLRRLLTGYRFDLALHLHEDYDGQGIYLYDLDDTRVRWGTGLLKACASRSLPVDARRRIDGWRFRDGLLAERIDLKKVPQQPEAIYLYRRHSAHCCTFETPSEFSLGHRVRAHVRLILEGLTRLKQLTTKKDAKTGILNETASRFPRVRRNG